MKDDRSLQNKNANNKVDALYKIWLRIGSVVQTFTDAEIEKLLESDTEHETSEIQSLLGND